MASQDPSDDYAHKPLTSPQSFRVLELFPSRDFNSTVSCEIREACLDDRVKYEALSYVWGEKKPGCSVSVGTETLAVTPNCLDALRHLRRQSERRVLWVDAICIDQRESQPSIRERNHQVELMGKIYSKAHTVLIWLGLGLSKYTKHFRVLTYISRVKLQPFKPLPKWLHRALVKMWKYQGWLSWHGTAAIDIVLLDDWWHRAWTFQEQAFARRCVIMCGRRNISIRDLLQGLLTAFILEPEAVDLVDFPTRRSLASHNRLNYEFDKLHEAANSVQSLRRLAKTVLTSAIFEDATLPVDNIYALYSLLVKYGLPLPEPDYNKAFEVVYEETVWAWIQRWQDLSILQTAARATHVQNLPSWVPAYHFRIEHYGERLAFKDHSWGYIRNEDNPYSGQAEATHPPGMLTVKGKYLGKVAYTWCDLRAPFAKSTLGNGTGVAESPPTWDELHRHLFDGNLRNLLGYDGMLRELFETLMFPRRSESTNFYFGDFMRWACSVGRMSSPRWIEEFETTVFPCSICLLDNSMFGKVNRWCEDGDEVFLLRGADCPFVLRKDGENYRLVGPAYVHRVHETQPWRFDGDDVRDITLV